ncbi:MAG TPA: hypothetical protein VIL37_18055 [Natronosporangium sp.]
MEAGSAGTVGRSYTKGRRQPYLIRKWPGSNWALPLGPYTITQLLVFVGSVYFLISYRDLWAHFGPFNIFIGVGLPLLLTYLTRHTRFEGRDPIRAGIALASLMMQSRTGYLGDAPLRPPKPVRVRGGRIPVADLPADLLPPPPVPTPPAGPPRVPRPPRAATSPRTTVPPHATARPWLSDLLRQAANQDRR